MTHLRLPACLAFGLLIGVPLPTALAQTTPPPASPALPSAPRDNATSAVTTTDAALLLQALKVIAAAPALSSESDLDIKAIKGGASVEIHEHLKVLSKKPNRFRSEVTLGVPDTGPVTKYEVVSDGGRVLTSQPGALQYSVTSLAAFKGADDDLPTLGILGGQLYLGTFAADMVAASNAMGGPFAKTISTMGMSLTGTSRDGLAVFTLTIPKTGKYVFSVDPQSHSLKQIELTGNASGASFSLDEKIASAVPAVAPPASFRVTTPVGLHKVKHVSVGSF